MGEGVRLLMGTVLPAAPAVTFQTLPNTKTEKDGAKNASSGMGPMGTALDGSCVTTPAQRAGSALSAHREVAVGRRIGLAAQEAPPTRDHTR